MIHTGLIMDGNRRWAKQHNLPIYFGHERGTKILTQFLEWAKASNKIRYVTAYAFSSDNWNRTTNEKNLLFDIFIQYIESNLALINENTYNTKIVFTGRRDRLPQRMVALMEELEYKTAIYSTYGLQIVIDYSQEWYIDEVIKKNKHPLNDFPEIDCVIRTGGERRLSNYMLHAIGNAELFFIDTLWPDCTNEIFNNVMTEFYKRERRYGR